MRPPPRPPLFPYTTLFRSRFPDRAASSACRNARSAQRASSCAWPFAGGTSTLTRSEEHTSELQSRGHLVCRLLLEKKKKHDNMSQIIIYLTNNSTIL